MSTPRQIVVGTAGHIDHGKSALVHALTGIDPDRLKEEKERGITIDLGFAHQEIDGINFAFVDVPGHERFVKNMLAGVGGIDLVVLVIAADESVMPQTREHFVEGMVHVSTMADDYYRFVESAHLLRGENTQKVYRLGDKVKVQVIRVNMELRQVDLGLVDILERVREGERGPRRSKASPKTDKRRTPRSGRRERQQRKGGRR